MKTPVFNVTPSARRETRAGRDEAERIRGQAFAIKKAAGTTKQNQHKTSSGQGSRKK